ncbi:SMP-30/gluconolactonase/LRE family protein [Mycolicibacterium fallax]|uniref:Gluconolactonase n=1 Tax=Mycolicibacterium fallax TaxID=1793 RepID=A0A1X1RJG2_MYCFA|nr:SMP-30/gluconolactonase/LRE family protein [Mycolicibacterium fallax]ORV07763.1 gluconolactonase [Mycolicibacterium fallax]BBY99162.1 gluconolactonase [Mycolicibacterium fallax]HOW93065.1 SMP-30/gluconolactonase/LRE family protein [Mycolicibacterium fallax]
MICKAPRPLAGGFCFGEGPRWRDGALWFSDMLGAAVHTVDPSGAMTTLPLPGHRPSGLGFTSDGALLIASTTARTLLRRDADGLRVIAELAELAPADLGDLVVDNHDRVYLGSQARTDGVLIRVDPDGAAAVVATGLDFPNGMVITDDGRTLIVAESTGRRLTAFTIAADGALHEPRVFAGGLDGPPDGLAIDADGGVWTALTLANRFDRIVEGGAVTDRVELGERVAIAPALGGPDGRTLFLLSSTLAYPERLVGTKLARVDTVTVEIPRGGLPS